MGQQDESGRKDQGVYYLSKQFTKYEIKYSTLQKTCALVPATLEATSLYALLHWLNLTSHMLPRSL